MEMERLKTNDTNNNSNCVDYPAAWRTVCRPGSNVFWKSKFGCQCFAFGCFDSPDSPIASCGLDF